MEQILKAARLEKAELNDEELALINRQTLRPLTAGEDVYKRQSISCATSYMMSQRGEASRLMENVVAAVALL